MANTNTIYNFIIQLIIMHAHGNRTTAYNNTILIKSTLKYQSSRLPMIKIVVIWPNKIVHEPVKIARYWTCAGYCSFNFTVCLCVLNEFNENMPEQLHCVFRSQNGKRAGFVGVAKSGSTNSVRKFFENALSVTH